MREPDALTYLDWAATSARRPTEVIRAITGYLETTGATPGRGGHRLAVQADRVALGCRQSLARLLGIPGDCARIAFMFNATHGLNTALAGTLRPGEAVVVTAFDHNAVLRCVAKLARERHVEVRTVPGRPDGTLDESKLDQALDGARLFAINAASNVLGTTLDVGRLCTRAREAGAISLVDTAQVAGDVPFDTAACGADIVAITGHKALLGPQGIGALWVREGVHIDPLLVGGTGGDSMLRDMPSSYPDHLQAGTLNAPGIAGLAAGVEWILERSVAALHARGAELKTRLWDGLASVARVHILSPRAPDAAPIVTLVADGLDPATLAGRLDRESGVLVRAGLHCAPETHRLLGTQATGALRFSLGWASVEADVDHAITAVDRIMGARVFAARVPDTVRGAEPARRQGP